MMHSDIRKLAKRIAALRKRAVALGIFADDRELLRCSHCGLWEDVDCTGRLLTYVKGRKPKDTGLRFRRLNQHVWLCPKCKTRIPCEST